MCGDFWQVSVRLPSGDRQMRRFESTCKVQALYEYVDSLQTFEAGSYYLVSNLPRVVYGPDKLDLTLNEAGLHPNASLFVEVDDS